MKKLITIIIAITMIITTPIYADNQEKTKIQFTDITDHWAKETIQELAEKEILNGYPDGSFKPDGNITRAEFSKVLRISSGLELIEDIDIFNDINDNWAKKEIETLIEKEIIVHEEYGDSYKPDENITRIEMSKMIIRALDLDEEAKEKVNQDTGFNDNEEINTEDRGYIILSVDREIINGFDDNTFRPNAEATRAETCKMIVCMLEAVKLEEEDKYAELRTEEGYIDAQDLEKKTFEEKGYDFKEELKAVGQRTGELLYEPDEIIEITKDMLPIKYYNAEITDFYKVNYDDVFFKGKNSFYWGLGMPVGLFIVEVNAVEDLASVGFEAYFIDNDCNMLDRMNAYQIMNNGDEVEKMAVEEYPNLPIQWVRTSKGEKCTILFQQSQDILDKTTKILLIDDLSEDKGDVLEIPID